MIDLLVSVISMVSSKECGRQVFFFPGAFLFALFYLGVEEGKVHLRVLQAGWFSWLECML